MKEKDKIYIYKNEQEFLITKRIKDYMYIDEKHKIICIPKISFWNGKFKPKKSKFYEFSQISNVELQVDGKVVSSVTRGGLGSAITGGILFGGAGVVLGAITGKRTTDYHNKNTFFIVIQLNDINEPCIQIEVYDRKLANEIISIMKIILEQKNDIVDNNIDSINKDVKDSEELLENVNKVRNDIKNEVKNSDKQNAQNNIENMILKSKNAISKILKSTWKVFRWCLSVAAVFSGINGDMLSLIFGISLLPLTYKLILKYFPKIKETKIKKVEIILPIIILIVIGMFYE